MASRMDELAQDMDDVQSELDAIESFEDDLKNADSFGETQLSELFHESRTTSTRHWNHVTAFCRITDDGVEVANVDKLSDGRWSPETRDRYDILVSVPVKPFKSATEFWREVQDDLRQKKQSLENKKCNIQTTMQAVEHRGDA
jgi:hypothetical protein